MATPVGQGGPASADSGSYSLGGGDLSVVYEVLSPVAEKYQTFGVQINVSASDIQEMRTKRTTPNDCLFKVLETRLKQTPSLTWRDIDAALRSDTVGEGQFADSISEIYSRYLFGPDTATRRGKGFSEDTTNQSIQSEVSTESIGTRQKFRDSKEFQTSKEKVGQKPQATKDTILQSHDELITGHHSEGKVSKGKSKPADSREEIYPQTYSSLAETWKKRKAPLQPLPSETFEDTEDEESGSGDSSEDEEDKENEEKDIQCDDESSTTSRKTKVKIPSVLSRKSKRAYERKKRTVRENRAKTAADVSGNADLRITDKDQEEHDIQLSLYKRHSEPEEDYEREIQPEGKAIHDKEKSESEVIDRHKAISQEYPEQRALKEVQKAAKSESIASSSEEEAVTDEFVTAKETFSSEEDMAKEHDIQPKKRSRRRHRESSMSPTTRGSSSPSTSQEENQRQPESKGKLKPNGKGKTHRKNVKKNETKEGLSSSTETDNSSPEFDMLKNISEAERKGLRKVFKRFFGRLCFTIKAPVELAVRLQMKGLLTYSVMNELLTSPESEQAKTITLVRALQKQVKSCPDRMFNIIQVFFA